MTHKQSKPFPITSACREGLESKGFDTLKVDNATMEKTVSKMADVYLDNGFWTDMAIVAEQFDITRK